VRKTSKTLAERPKHAESTARPGTLKKAARQEKRTAQEHGSAVLPRVTSKPLKVFRDDSMIARGRGRAVAPTKGRGRPKEKQ
jgi:hypothetical protein